jgi:hypothetical protein
MSEGCLEYFDKEGKLCVLYEPLPHQLSFHGSTAPNLLALGTRGTGKSLQLRMDAILRCLLISNFKALIVRRTMPELRKSHLGYIDWEMSCLGGHFLKTTFIAMFPNGSTLTFGHCETEEDILNYLSSEYGFVGFDELSTFTLNQFLQISAAARAPLNAPYEAVVRAGSNPLGVGAEWMEQWFCTKNVHQEDYPDYNPNDFEMQFSTLDDNIHIDSVRYKARLKNLPEHVRRAWLKGEFVTEGMYFSDFRKKTEAGDPWHVIDDLPTLNGKFLFDHTWLSVYRAIDWGYFPDPAVCLWIAVLPNRRAVVFKERKWVRTLAANVAQQIRQESLNYHCIDSFADPSMFIKTGTTAFSIGEIFEQNGVPLTPSINSRELYGYAIHNFLNTIIDGTPQLQIVKPLGLYGCPELIRTLPTLRMDKNDSRKLADGDDHWVVALAYFCMSLATPSQDPKISVVPRWMRPKSRRRI